MTLGYMLIYFLPASLPEVCTLPHPVFKVTATQLVTHENVKTSFRDLR